DGFQFIAVDRAVDHPHYVTLPENFPSECVEERSVAVCYDQRGGSVVTVQAPRQGIEEAYAGDGTLGPAVHGQKRIGGVGVGTVAQSDARIGRSRWGFA